MTRCALILTTMICVCLVAPSRAQPQCPSDMVVSGAGCIDKYEASLWRVIDPGCIIQIKQGQNLPPHCLQNAQQVGIAGVDYTDAQCQFNGGGCKNIFALAIPGVIPARSINYFVAAAACRNTGKRLPSNAEWQAAALGTPDPWPQDDPANQCNVSGPAIALTGSRSQVRLRRRRLRHGRQRHRVRRRLGRAGHHRNELGRVHRRASAATSATWGDRRTERSTGFPARRCAAAASRSAAAGTTNVAGVYAIDQNGAPNSIGDASAAGFRCAK